MSNIPHARQALEEAMKTGRMDHFTRDSIHEALQHMTRRSPTKRAPATGNRLDPMRRASIILEYRTTDITQAELAAKHGVNPGRISELFT